MSAIITIRYFFSLQPSSLSGQVTPSAVATAMKAMQRSQALLRCKVTVTTGTTVSPLDLVHSVEGDSTATTYALEVDDKLSMQTVKYRALT